MDRTPVISLGAGVQSSTLLLMAAREGLEAHGYETPRLAIFSDTGAEPAAVYEWLAYLRMEAYRAGIEVATVTGGNLRDDAVAAAAGERGAFPTVPFYVTNQAGGEGRLQRQCTKDYKIAPLRRELRRRGLNSVDVLLGISTDEVTRMKPSSVQWARNRWPLIDAGMSRTDCVRWLEAHGYPRPPKSACVFCPFHTDRQWRELRDGDPESWEEAVDFDLRIRRLPRVDGDVYLHRQRVPLAEVDLATAEDRGQLAFEGECEGMCGV